MKVTGLIRRTGEVKKTSKNYDLKVEAVISPSRTYVVDINLDCEMSEDIKEKYTQFEYRNIISIIYGTITEGNLNFKIQMIVYSNVGWLTNQIILSECLDNPNYVFDYDTDSSYSIQPSYLLNMDDLQTLPEYSGKTVFESIEYFANAVYLRSDYENIHKFYKLISQNKVMTYQEFNNYIDPPF